MVMEGEFSFQFMRSSIIYERAILTEYFDYDASRKPYIYIYILDLKILNFIRTEKQFQKSSILLQIHHETVDFLEQKK
jgi:hypothetical protein